MTLTFDQATKSIMFSFLYPLLVYMKYEACKLKSFSVIMLQESVEEHIDGCLNGQPEMDKVVTIGLPSFTDGAFKAN